MAEKLDIARWERRPHFELFRGCEEPYFGVCVRVDCTAAYAFAKQAGCSFFLLCLHRSLAAAQRVPNFHYRIDGDDVLVHDRIDAGSTVNRSNGPSASATSTSARPCRSS